MDRKLLPVSPVIDYVAATSVGIIDGRAYLDLDYEEDSSAEVDMNCVMTGRGLYVEIQGTAEKTPFTPEQLKELQNLSAVGIRQLVQMQKSVLATRTDLQKLFPNNQMVSG